jgi:hypothetical protein
MNWYLAKLVFRIICGDGNHTAQFDEQLRMISADNHAEALQKSINLGEDENDVFFNQQEQLVHWQFVTVCELYSLGELSDGIELYSRVEETGDPDNYLRFIQAKAEQVRNNCSYEWLNTA